MAFPEATADEVRRYILENNPNPTLYSRCDITRAEQRLGFTKKVGSVTANQALSPRCIFIRHLYWTRHPPLGIFEVPLLELIDTDEAGVMLSIVNRSGGKAYNGARVRSIGPYSRSEKWTIILAIGSDGFKHCQFTNDPGTTAEMFLNFINSLMDRIPQGQRRTFIWDNLKSHFSAEIYLAVHLRGHRIVPRPPWYPVDGPIEFVFNQYEMGLRERLYVIRNTDDLINHTHQVIANIRGIPETFAHCGYH